MKKQLMNRQEVDFAPGEKTYGLKIFREEWFNPETGKTEIHWKYGLPDGVQVTGFTTDKKVIAIEETFFEKGAKLHLIGETIELGERPFQAAKRGLLEEAGYESENWVFLSTVMENSKKSDRKIYYFLALDCYRVGEGESNIKVVLMDPVAYWDKLMAYFLNDPDDAKVAGNSLKLTVLAYEHLGLLQLLC